MASGSECESDAELMEASSRGAEGRRRWWSCFRSADSYTVAPGSIAPRDRGHLVYVCMVMAGAGFLFPWSSYVTAIDYFFFLYWKDFHQVSCPSLAPGHPPSDEGRTALPSSSL